MPLRAMALVLGIVAGTLGLAACASCSAPSSPTADAGADSSDARVKDAVAEDTSAWWDGGVISDWPGWRRLTEIEPTCVVDVPIDLSKVTVPTPTWVPCTNGNPKCVELDRSVFNPLQPSLFRYALTSPTGKALAIVRAIAAVQADNLFEWDVYSLPDMVPIAAWREQLGLGPACQIELGFTPTQAAMAVRIGDGPRAAVGPLSLLQTKPPIVTYVPQVVQGSTWQFYGASDTTIAFELSSIHRVVRAKVGSPDYTFTNGVKLSYMQTHGDDVYAKNEFGIDGWDRVMRIDADGSTTPFIAPTKRHASRPITDETTWMWSESYGAVDSTEDPQPTNDLFSAPYTNDPATLKLTQKKIVTLPQGTAKIVNGVARAGYFAFQATRNETYVVRASDGKVQTVPNVGGKRCWMVVHVTENDLWCIEEEISGPTGGSVTKTTLDPW
jgi:hypothetical protein